MRERDIASIGDIYGKMLNGVKTIKESKEPKTFEGEFRNKKEKDGPESADGYNKADHKTDKEEDEEDDVSKYLPKKKKDEDEEINDIEEDEENDDSEDDVSDEDDNSDEEDEEILESKKIATKSLNKHMSKSAFDTLFKKVLKENFGQPQEGDDLDALGLDDSTPDADLGDDFGGDDDFGGEDEDTVTVTLDRATAQALVDVLQGVLGGEDEGEDDMGEDDLDFGGDDDFGGEDDGMDFEEDEETQGTKPAPDKKAAFQGKSNKVGGKANPKGGNKAKTDVTDNTNTTNSAPPITALQGKSNQVPGSTLKAKADYFK